MCNMNVSNLSNKINVSKSTNDIVKNASSNDLKGFFAMLSGSGVSGDIGRYNELVERYRAMRQGSSYISYLNVYNDIVAYYVAHGKHTASQYEPIWDWQYNCLYLRRDVYRVKHQVMVDVVDELLIANYEEDDIRRVVRYLLLIDFTKTKDIINDMPEVKPVYGNIGTSEYIEFLEVLSTTKDDDMLISSPTLTSIINYYFDFALCSIGCVPFSFTPNMYSVIGNHMPLHVALDYWFTPQSQGSVEDFGYLDILTRSVKSTIDIPYQIHKTFESVATTSNTMSMCADKMDRLGDAMHAFIESFLQRTDRLATGLSSEAMISMVEIFIDFMSDLPDLKAVSSFRWITYCSRVLRLFIPNGVSLAFNLFSTHLACLFTAVAQGLDDVLQTILVVFSGAIALQNVPDRVGVNKMMEYMKSLNIAVPFSKNMVAVIQSMISMLPEAVKAWASQYIPEHVFYMKLTTQYAEVINRIDIFLTYDIDRIYFDRNLSKEIVILYNRAHELVRDMAPFVRDVSGEFSLLREQLRKFDKLYESVQSIMKCGVIRECPFSLTIAGDSQIGKSTLSAAIAKYMYPDAPADRVRYVIPTDPDEFWSGYSPLHCVTAEDDADQDAEYKNALQLFSIVTNAPYQPPMASVDDKSIGVKGTPYHSKMHIRCTNNPYPKPLVKILTLEAYWRRRHMLVKAVVKDDYLVDGKVQYSPVFKHLEFWQMDPVVEGGTPVKIGDFMDFMKLLRTAYDRHTANEKAVVDMMTSNTDTFTEQIGAAYQVTDVFTDAQGRLTDFLNDMQLKAVTSATGTYNALKNYLENHPVISQVLKLCAIVAGVSTAALGMVSLYSAMFINASAESIPSGDMRTSKYRRIKRPAFSEGTTDPTAESLVLDVVRGRQCVCQLYDRRTTKMNQMTGLFIGGRYVLFPYHLFVAPDGQLVEPNSRMVLTTDQAVFEQMFEVKRMTQLFAKDGSRKDCCVYECTLQVRAFKDIRQHFIADNELTAIPNWCEASINKFSDFSFERQLINVNPITQQKYNVTGVLEAYTLYKGFQYDAITTSGDCGSIIVLYNTKVRGKILGLHVAGDRNRHHGYCELVSSDSLKQFVPRVQPQSRITTCDDEPAIILPEGNYTYYGSVPAGAAVYPITKTEIKPSIIQGVITQPITHPVDMNKRDFPEVISRFFHTTQPVNPAIKAVLLQDACDNADALNSFRMGVVSEYIAINGDSKYPYCERMNMSTSPGLPYKKLKAGKGKSMFFRQDEAGNYVVNDVYLRTAIDNRLAMAQQGLSAPSMWMDIPKDERRKPEKKVRMIITPPLDYQIVFRMYFLDYIVAYYNSRLKNHSAVGINPYSLDWTDLMHKLQANSDVGGDGDHKHMDGNMLNDLMEIEIDSINHFYRYEVNHDVASRVREVLWNELVHTPTQCMNVAYCVHCGNPSGCNCTTIINTNACDRYYKLAWLGLAPMELRSMKSFYNAVCVVAYGDDSIVSIKREVLSWYNFKTISEHLKDLYGITFTMADKSGDMLESKPITDCIFLKNGFRRDGMIYHAIMDESTLQEMVNWIRDSDDDYAASVVNANMALMMWYHYGIERFTKERDLLHAALVEAGKKHGNIPHLLTWDYLDMCFVTDRNPIATDDVPIIEANSTIVETITSLPQPEVKKGLFASLFRSSNTTTVDSEGGRTFVRLANFKWKKMNPDIKLPVQDAYTAGKWAFLHCYSTDPELMEFMDEFVDMWLVAVEMAKSNVDYSENQPSYTPEGHISFNYLLTIMQYGFLLDVVPDDTDEFTTQYYVDLPNTDVKRVVELEGTSLGIIDRAAKTRLRNGISLGMLGATLYGGYKLTKYLYDLFKEREWTNNLVDELLRDSIAGNDEIAVAQGGEKDNAGSSTAGEADEANVKEETNVAGAVTFIEQKPSIDIDKSISPRDSENLMFGAWSIQRIFGKPQRLGTYAFTTTSAQGDVLKSFDLPRVLNTVAVWAPVMSAFTFMKYRPVFRIQINGNKFAAGRLMAFILPYSIGSVDFFPTGNKNISGYTGFDHVFLDASSNDTVTITAPWVMPYEWMNITDYTAGQARVSGRYTHQANSSYFSDNSHTFRLMVFNPLSVGTGAPTTIYATVFLHLEDVELCVPRVSSATSQGGTHSYVTNTVTNWEKVASQALPTNITGDAFDINADLKVSTMDKPAYTLGPEPLVRRAIGYMSHCVNVDPLQRLCMYPSGTSTSTPKDYGTTYDEMEISYLCGKYTYWYSTSVNTTMAPGAVIEYIPVTPYICPRNDVIAPRLLEATPVAWSPPSAVANIPLVSYVSMPFNFWGGSMKFRFDFITNSFVTMKVWCAIIYGTACPETITAGIEPTSGLGYTFEVNGDSKTFEVEVPFVSDTPWKRIMRSQFVQAGVSGVSSAYDDSIAYDSCVGQIALYVLNPLAVPAGLPTAYPVNVFVAGGKDFRLNFISRANTSWIPYAQGIDPNPGTDLSHLGQTIMATDLACMSEQYKSIKDVLKRYCHVRTAVTEVNGYGLDFAQFFPVVATFNVAELLMPFFTSGGQNINNASNVINWYLALFRFFRGSLRFKILFEVFSENELAVDMPAISVDFIPDRIDPTLSADFKALMGVNDESLGPGGPVTASVQTTYNMTHHGPRDMASRVAPQCEFEIPYVMKNRICPLAMAGPEGTVNLDWNTAGSRGGTRRYEMSNPGTIIVNYAKMTNAYRCVTRIFMSVGDDFRAGCQIGQPLISYAGGTAIPATNSNFAVPPDVYTR